MSSIPILIIQFNFKIYSNFEHSNFLSVARAVATTGSRGVGGRDATTEDGNGGDAGALDGRRQLANKNLNGRNYAWHGAGRERERKS
jgi:hypothetical protein